MLSRGMLPKDCIRVRECAWRSGRTSSLAGVGSTAYKGPCVSEQRTKIMDRLTLTVAIPTFNRADQLRHRLDELVQQAQPGVQIAVFNDGSTDATEAVVADFEKSGVRYSATSPNQGLGRNLLRCWENAESEWLWILGDDDPVSSDGVARALSLIASYPDACAINFESNASHNEHAMVCATLTELFEVKDATALMFISSLLFRVSAIKPHLKVAAQSAITIAPHLPLMLRTVEKGEGPMAFSTERLLRDQNNAFRWSSLELALGLAFVPEFINESGPRRTCAIGLWNSTRWMYVMGLREANDAASWQRWKRTLRKCNSLLRAEGATFLARNFFSPNERAMRSKTIICLIRWLPWVVARYACRIMRRRWAGDDVSLDNA